MATKLKPELVEKPWGREQIPAMFGPAEGRRIGEVWFTGPDNLPLLVKYIFTSESLSIQVHPDDRQARERGLPGGKNECWYILDAEPDAKLGLGLVREVPADALRAAALDGSIEELMNWRPVRAGDFFYVPAGTVHAIGAGVSLLEFQQNQDVTYRLYDFGRPRELHLEDGMAVARAEPYPDELARHVEAGEDRVLLDGPLFSLLHQRSDVEPANLQGRQRWVMPLDGEVVCGAVRAAAGDCLLLGPGEKLERASTRVLIGASGSVAEG